jgi:hypothetical protein
MPATKRVVVVERPIPLFSPPVPHIRYSPKGWKEKEVKAKMIV